MKPTPKVTICFKRRTLKIQKSKLKAYRKKGAKVGACKPARTKKR